MRTRAEKSPLLETRKKALLLRQCLSVCACARAEPEEEARSPVFPSEAAQPQSRFGASKKIFCNLSWDSCREVVRLLSEKWNISQALTPADPAPCLDSRTKEWLKASICNIVSEKPSKWEDLLHPILFGIRTPVGSMTRYAPFFLYNRYPCLPSKAEYSKEPAKDEAPGAYKANGLPPFRAATQKQQNAAKETVPANVMSSNKDGQKSSRRKSRDLSSLTCEMEGSGFGNNNKPSLKKLKSGPFISFQIEMVLAPGERLLNVKKTG